ncbi:MAG: ABC transporter ATP-binding protein, partial [Nitrososphaerota archaeon]|nr:ABC transporter ATP-binding protein [Nitrososphaerota archaeon]
MTDKENDLLTITDLTVNYEFKEGQIQAIDSVRLNIEKNKFIAIVGESGCGKSTLALAIIGLIAIPPAKIPNGKIEYKSVDLLSLKENDRRKYRGTEIAMIFQEPLTSLNPVYKVGDQIAEAIVIREQRKGKAESSIENEVMQKVYNAKAPTIPSRIHIPRRGLSKL